MANDGILATGAQIKNALAEANAKANEPEFDPIRTRKKLMEAAKLLTTDDLLINLRKSLEDDKAKVTRQLADMNTQDSIIPQLRAKLSVYQELEDRITMMIRTGSYIEAQEEARKKQSDQDSQDGQDD